MITVNRTERRRRRKALREQISELRGYGMTIPEIARELGQPADRVRNYAYGKASPVTDERYQAIALGLKRLRRFAAAQEACRVEPAPGSVAVNEPDGPDREDISEAWAWLAAALALATVCAGYLAITI